MTALSAFFGTTLRGTPYPACSWEFAKKGNDIVLHVKATPDQLQDAILWSADSEDRDFRNEVFSSKSLGKSQVGTLTAIQPLPEKGYRAFYVDLKYSSPTGGTYTVSTRMFVANKLGVL